MDTKFTIVAVIDAQFIFDDPDIATLILISLLNRLTFKFKILAAKMKFGQLKFHRVQKWG